MCGPLIDFMEQSQEAPAVRIEVLDGFDGGFLAL
jgi:hypothetical protein